MDMRKVDYVFICHQWSNFYLKLENCKLVQPKTFWKIETAHAIFWMYLGGTA